MAKKEVLIKDSDAAKFMLIMLQTGFIWGCIVGWYWSQLG